MGKFSTGLDVSEIYYENDIYTIIFKSINLPKENDFVFEYNKDLNIENFKTVCINQLAIRVKYLNVKKDEILFKDENLNVVASMDFYSHKMLAIRKYKSMLTLSLIGRNSYRYLIECNRDKIK